MTSGSPVTIASGWVNPWDPLGDTANFPTTPVSLRVDFGGSISASDTFSIMYIDPWGSKGLYGQAGSGNKFTGEIGGYVTSVDNAMPESDFNLGYTQIANTDFQVRATGSNSTYISRENNNTTANNYAVHASATPIIVSPFTGMIGQSVLTNATYTGLTYQVVLGTNSGVVTLQEGSESRAVVTASLDLSHVIGSPVTVSAEIVRKKNDGTVTVLAEQVRVIASGVRDQMLLTVVDTEIAQKVHGVLDKHEYYVMIKTGSGSHSVAVGSTLPVSSTLRVDRAPAYG